jgi:hypothetical protein
MTIAFLFWKAYGDFIDYLILNVYGVVCQILSAYGDFLVILLVLALLMSWCEKHLVLLHP